MICLNGKPCLIRGWAVQQIADNRLQQICSGICDYETREGLHDMLKDFKYKTAVHIENVEQDKSVFKLSVEQHDILHAGKYFTIAPEFHDKEQQKSVRKLFIKEVYAIVNRPQKDLCLIDDWAKNIELSEDLQRNIKWYMKFTIPDIVFPGGLQNFIENIWEIGNKDVRESMSTILFPYGL